MRDGVNRTKTTKGLSNLLFDGKPLRTGGPKSELLVFRFVRRFQRQGELYLPSAQATVEWYLQTRVGM